MQRFALCLTLALVFGAGALCTGGFPSAFALNPKDIKKAQRTAKDVHKEGRYGDSLGLQKKPKPRKRGCLDNGCQGCQSGCGGCEQALKPMFEVTGGCAQIAPWVFLGIALFLLLLWLQQHIRRIQATKKVEPEVVESAPTVLGMEVPVDADPLAYAKLGQWEMAIATILLQCLKEVGWKSEGKGKSQTPREILRTLPSSDTRRNPLRQLLVLTERVRFGGEPATETLFTEAQTLGSQVKKGGVV